MINRPALSTTPEELGRTWQQLIPWDNQQDNQMISYDDGTAKMKICIPCPQRVSGDRAACDKFLNYDITLMKKAGGTLTVLESQSESSHDYCILSIKVEKSLR